MTFTDIMDADDIIREETKKNKARLDWLASRYVEVWHKGSCIINRHDVERGSLSDMIDEEMTKELHHG